MKEFIAVGEALEIVSAACNLSATESVEIQNALGRVIADAVVATDPIPPFDNSAMDGYAVRRDDVTTVPKQLRVVGEIAAGAWPENGLQGGECFRIMTGAPIPPGADCIVPVEWTQAISQNATRVLRTPPLHYSVRRKGDDVEAGDEVIPPGSVVSPPVVGMLASLGLKLVPVRRRPRVSILATGSEIVDHRTQPRPGQVRNSNGPALAAQTMAAGGEVVQSSTVGDDMQALQQKIEKALAADVVVLSGGVSVGAYDLVQDALRELGVDLKFWKVRQRPGKPLLFGERDGTLVFGLPGNPVSSSICFDRFVRPALSAMLGRRDAGCEKRRAVLETSMKKVEGLHYFARGVFTQTNEGTSVRPSGSQSSAVYSALVHANCIIHLPEDMVDPVAGTTVTIEPLSWLSG
ncbi:MAG: molybdopterin molybdotransferase MoeA [Rhodothermia bacterium]|nr:molybdopterin molybdotransferase MoeA [Rhodothermia bacterium]